MKSSFAQAFAFNNISNVSLLNYMQKTDLYFQKLMFSKIYEVLLQNYIEDRIHVKYNIPVHLKLQQRYFLIY